MSDQIREAALVRYEWRQRNAIIRSDHRAGVDRLYVEGTFLPRPNGDQLPPVIDGTEPHQSYEQARTEEFRIRSQLYRLRAGRLSGELLDRKLLVSELTAMFTAVREIILSSTKLTQGEKAGLLRQLASIPVVLTSPANRPRLH